MFLCVVILLLAHGCLGDKSLQKAVELYFLSRTDFTKNFHFESIFPNGHHLSAFPKIFEGIILENADDTNFDCIADTFKILKGLENKEPWSIAFADSSAKVSAGLMGGAIKWLGSFNECLYSKFYFPSNSSIQPKYCMVDANLPSLPVPLQFALCVPKNCSEEFIQTHLNKALNHMSTSMQTTVHCRNEGLVHLDTWSVLALLSCSILGTLLIVATIIEIYIYFLWQSQLIPSTSADECQTLERVAGEILPETETESLHLLELDVAEKNYQNYRSGWIRSRTFATVILCFSPVENARKIFASEKHSHRLGCLHGFRCLTMAWIVLGHTFAWSLLYSNNAMFFLREQSKDWRSQVLFGAAVAVDTFFFMSGLLTVYRCMPLLADMRGFGKKAHFWIWFAFQRFIRITPLWLFVIVLFLGIVPSANDGPLYDTLEAEFYICRRNWWAIFVNNFVHEDEMCLPWTWYLSNEMQFSIILAPIFLTLVQWRPWLGHLFVIGLVASGIGSVAYTSFLHNMPPSFLGALTPGFFVFYVRPYNRWGPFAIGLFTGWLLLTPCTKVKTWVQKDWKRGLLVSTLGLSLALLIILTAIYCLYGELSGTAPPMTVHQSAAYNALIRVVWSIALAIIVLLCANGLAGPINAFLSWDLFVKFGRITFGVYLVHPIILFVIFGSALQPAIMENLSMIVDFLGCLILSASVSLVLSLTIESPLLALARCF